MRHYIFILPVISFPLLDPICPQTDVLASFLFLPLLVAFPFPFAVSCHHAFCSPSLLFFTPPFPSFNFFSTRSRTHPLLHFLLCWIWHPSSLSILCLLPHPVVHRQLNPPRSSSTHTVHLRATAHLQCSMHMNSPIQLLQAM